MATHASVPAWKIPWAEEPGRLQSMGSHRVKGKEKSEVAQLCLTLCDPVDCSLPGFSVHGILQARILEWVTISFSSSTS